MPNFGYVTVYSRSGSTLRTSSEINLSSYTVDSFLTYMAEQGGPNYITTVSISLGGTAVSGSENLSNLTGGSTLDLYDVTPQTEKVTGFYLDGTKYELGGGVTSVNGQTGNVTIETFQIAPNSPLAPKYRRYGTQAQYDALTQYYTEVAGDTVYFTI